jgi:hypothetical protein
VSVLSIGLRLNDIYTDDYHAPPSCPVSWFLKPGEYGSTGTGGRVNFLSISEKGHSLEFPNLRRSWLQSRESEEQPEEREEPKPDVAAAALRLAEIQVAQTQQMVSSLKRLTTAVVFLTGALVVGFLI